MYMIIYTLISELYNIQCFLSRSTLCIDMYICHIFIYIYINIFINIFINL